ncbi:MAG: excinuclease ABC subunit UvrC [Myxococcota bacterium]
MRSGSGSDPARDPLQERVAALPVQPGVYLFKDARGGVLYVGKAQNLRSRVRSYFVRGGDGRFRVHLLVPQIADVEVVVTGNVKEALLLENQLIKKHKPRFNVRLRDDKNYLALRLDPDEPYPRFTETRRFQRDGAIYFGPYTSSNSLRRTLSALQRIFPLRTCSDSVMQSYRRRGRPCLEHALGRCAAPCCDLIDNAAYAELVKGATLFMKGQADDLLSELEARMEAAAADERFEEAARLRDRIQAVERTIERQSMVSTRFVDRDVFGLARDGGRLEIQVLHVRQGKLLGGNVYAFGDVRVPDGDALDSFLGQFYAGDRDVPREVLLPVEVDGRSALEAILRERAGRAVALEVPRRGERRELIRMAERNAGLSLLERRRREEDTEGRLEALRELLRLPELPRRIECYDISHLHGVLSVGSRVVFVDGKPSKSGYRRYKLRDTNPGDDYAGMREVVRRRLARLQTEPAPDLLLLDGGKGQLNAVRAVLSDLSISDIPLASLAKERDDEAPSPRVRRHGGPKREKLFLPGVKDPLELRPESPATLLLQQVRDESHRFAIRYHRELRSKAGLRSILDELPGIGPVKRRALLSELGSLQRIRTATTEQLAAVRKISRADAELISRFFASSDNDGVVEADPRAANPEESA